jgi:hypothetical protein
MAVAAFDPSGVAGFCGTRQMKKNVIILTSGLAGSSVLAGLIARGGWWAGDETFKKADYDTFENRRLIEVNRDLFVQLGYRGNYEMVFDAADISLFSGRSGSIDAAPFRELLAECQGHSPWLWKDPRLWLTIHRWVDYLDLDQIQFINLTRDPLQAWISLTIRRQIQEFGYLKSYLDRIRATVRNFLVEQGAEHIELVYEDLLLRPEQTIDTLNRFIGASLEIADLQAVYRGRLYRKSRGIGDALKAGLIHAKNYRARYR